jgi:glycosyltransferase involved in cell wall biosynthesis
MQEEGYLEPKVSVIITNYNYGCYLRQAIESVLAQTYSNIELIVVDDGSNDNTWEVLKDFPNIKLIIQNREGVSAARNRGAAIATGDYLCFLDADDFWAPTKVEKQAQKLRENSNLGAVTVGTYIVDADGNLIHTDVRGQSGFLARNILLFERYNIFTSMMIRKSYYFEIGGFDKNLSTSADLDLSLRLAVNYPFEHLEEPLYFYRIHRNNMHSNIKLFKKDMDYFLNKSFNNNHFSDIKSKVYGLYYKILSGLYYQNKKYTIFIFYLILSILTYPANIQFYYMKIRQKTGKLMKIFHLS